MRFQQPRVRPAGCCVLALFAMSVTGLTAGVARGAEVPAVRETFVVEPFANVNGARSMDYLEIGAPALIAERFGQDAPLRFVGATSIFGARPVGADPKWVVGGRFQRRPDWKIEVTVELRPAGTGGEPVSRKTGTGSRDDVAVVALQVARAAFAALPGLDLPPSRPWMTAPFGRDPYAFVLYGRALAQYHGAGARARSAERAIEIFVRSLVIDPKVPETRRYLGIVHMEAGRPGHARALWASALEARPQYVAALAALAALDRAAGLPEARERYARLLELDPEDMDARRIHGELLSQVGEFDRAQVEFERVLAARPGDLRARRALALVLASRRAGKELVADLEEVVKLDPEDVDSRMDLGAAYVSVGMMAEGAAIYEDVLRRRPRHTAALKLAGDLALGLGDLRRAAAHYDRLHRLAPADPRPLFILGAAYFRAGQLDAAERLFTEGAQLPGMLADGYANLGAIALRRGQTREALSYLGRAVKRRPDKAIVRYNHALALHTARRSADALNELRAAQILDPDDAGVRFLAGVVSLRLGLLHEAEANFREAARLDPHNEDARHNLAVLEPLVRPSETSLSFVEGPAAVGRVVATSRNAP